MQRCPKCQSGHVHRSRARSKWEAWRALITNKRPYRCHSCAWRGWDFDRGPKFAADEVEMTARPLEPDLPDLKETILTRDEPRLELNLDQLNVLAAVAERRKAD